MTKYSCHSKEMMDNKVRKFRSASLEVTLVNKRLVKLNSETKAYMVKVKNQNYALDVCELKD